MQNLTEGDTDRIFILAHSAGGVYVSSLVLTPALFSSPISGAIEGLVHAVIPFGTVYTKMAAFWNPSMTEDCCKSAGSLAIPRTRRSRSVRH